MNKDVVIIGGGGHGKVIADIVIKSGDKLIGFLDDNITKETAIIDNYKVIGNTNNIDILDKNIEYIIAIGDNEARKEISRRLNVKLYTAVHPNSNIGLDVKIGKGTVIMSNTVVNSSAKIGNHCIINTGAIIEHDNVIQDYVHISPNATLGGTVRVGKCTHIGIGATIKNNVSICENCIIGAGAVVVNNIKEEGTYIGIPAIKIK